MRTKVEIILLCMLLVIIAVTSVASIPRIISNTGDNFDTFIRNSNGNYWSSTASNIQIAIDDLNDNPGTVWLPGNTTFTLSSGIIIGDGILLDLGGSTIKPSSSFNIISMKNGSQIKNGAIDASEITFNHACILFDGHYQIDELGSSVLSQVENLYLKSANQKGKGIYMVCDDKTAVEKIVFVTCRSIRTRDFEYAIHLECSGGSTSYDNFINGNNFFDIIGKGDKYFIYLERDTSLNHVQSGVEGNYFENCIFQAGTETECVLHIDGESNIFDVYTWDWWKASGSVSYDLTSDSQGCYLRVQGGADDLVDSGNDNTIFIPISGNMTIDELNIDERLFVHSINQNSNVELFTGTTTNPILYLCGYDSGETATKQLGLTILSDGTARIQSDKDLSIRVETDNGELHIQDNAESDINCFYASGTGENKLLKVFGRDSGDSYRGSVNIQWGDGTRDSGIITSTNGDLILEADGGQVSFTSEVKVKIYRQSSPPDIEDNTVAYWYNSAGSSAYTILDVDGTQYYTSMSTTY